MGIHPYRMQSFLNFINQSPIQLKMMPQYYLSSFVNASNSSNDDKDKDKDKAPYYDCVYLCIKYETDVKYKCINFDSYEKAEEYYKNVYSHRANSFTKKLIPFCSYTPKVLHNIILDFKLRDKWF